MHIWITKGRQLAALLHFIYRSHNFCVRAIKKVHMKMLNYSDTDVIAKDIAIFYVKKLNNPFAEEFFGGSRSLANADEALEVAKVFWNITDLPREDHLNNVPVLDNVDLEFWTHKFFNKVYGYYEKNGFKEQWRIAEDQQ